MLTLCGSLSADDFSFSGNVEFSNINASLESGEPAPYLGVGFGPQIGFGVQTGSILPTSEPTPIDDTGLVLQFSGVVGPNPYFDDKPIHVIQTSRGQIHTKWEALFTIFLDPQAGTVQFSGLGCFTVVGGTRYYRRASGAFETFFITDPTPIGSDTAVASFMQDGLLDRRFGLLFEGSATGVFEDPGNLNPPVILNWEGVSTVLGEFTRREEATINPDGTVEGVITWTDSRGDQLDSTFVGFFVNPNEACGTYTFLGGTGRYTGAEGYGVWYVETPDFVNASVEFNGALKLGRGRGVDDGDD
jgi:hypothetical protein